MRLKQLNLSNFKNYSELSVIFDEKNPIILVGNNGQGKTNFLQAIAILALSKSFNPTPLPEMVNWNSEAREKGLADFFRIDGTVESRKGNKKLEVFCGRSKKYPKTLKIDGLKTKAKDYLGNLRIVLFTPQDLNLIFLSPQLRRRYINLLICQVDKEYLEHLSQYQVYLKQRNKLLLAIAERKSQESELDFWDEKLSEHGAYILSMRREVVQALNQELSAHYEKISGSREELVIHWSKDWKVEGLEEYRKVFYEYLLQKRGRDLEAGASCGGPHREDFEIRMNGKIMSDSGSRGECRSAILALKLTELDYIKEITGESPVVLFDDVFSELDIDRQKNLLKLFKADQVFITATHLDHEVEGGVIWELANGIFRSEFTNNPKPI